MRMTAWVLAITLADLMQSMAVGAPGDEIYAKPGQIVSAGGGARLNLYCLGSGSPTVVFDAGHQDWAPAWAVVQREVATWARACSYDRAGAGFSDAGPMPRTSVRIADELHAALHKAGITGPYILVGHAFGGINVRTFAYRYMPEVAGLVLIDTDTGGVDPPAVLKDEHHIFDVQAGELRACRDALAAGRPLASTPPSTLQAGIACEQRFFRGFPEKAWSEELNTQLLHVAQTRVALYDEVVSELQEMPGDEVYLRQHQQTFGSRPIRVLTNASLFSDTEKTSGAAHLRHLKIDLERSEAQARYLMLSSNARQTFAYHSASAYIQLDQPELVVEAIREVYPAEAQVPAPGTQFRDCTNGCPEMVMLPRGSFIMGAPPGEEERESVPAFFRGHSVPQHLVRIRYWLAIAKFDVTRDEYAQFVAETNRPDPDSCYTPDLASGKENDTNGANWHSPGYPQTGRDPVVCVNWDDAQAYVAWLSAKTGHVYRLPTEAEWEYAARAGSTTPRYGSDSPAELCRYINHADLNYSEQHPRDTDVNRECRDGYAFTSPVGSFPPNQFGLHDMLGNVWQWNEDCWNANYNGAPSDGSSWQSGDCGRRIVRGAAYSNVPGLVLSAVRSKYKSSGRDHSGGFRVARTF